ncbi:MAG TPA: methyltransferase [Bacteroidales bacterium]|nr:MAG: hypothetical protein A2W98_11535 [Bacteroidetes bacterium GWF2_33_38]OFY74867.1 MAG: hypothetical protein A2265_04110 [Bacteroidetes bacterium RIFOXYA12_FULL_33_9]HBF89380.1 methyltransferase [Bacteroidales bacterium]
MKTPITYYGGKQMLVKHLLLLIPAHRLYCEPFFGGGALFFAKPKSEVEVINDLNGEVINFYKVLKTNFKELEKEVKATLHSRELYNKAREIYKNPTKHSELKRAWAFWTLTNQGFAGMITSWGFGNTPSKEKSLANKRDAFTPDYADRLRTVQIECNDALKVMDRCDGKDTFFYLDPPYFNSDMGHYKGYTEADYTKLLEKAAKLKGKFLLSSYPSAVLNKFLKKHKWYVQKITKSVAVTKYTDKQKTEMMVSNYNPKQAGKFTPKEVDLKKLTGSLKRLKFAA